MEVLEIITITLLLLLLLLTCFYGVTYLMKKFQLEYFNKITLNRKVVIKKIIESEDFKLYCGKKLIDEKILSFEFLSNKFYLLSESKMYIVNWRWYNKLDTEISAKGGTSL